MESDRLFKEILGSAVIVAGIFLLLSFASFHPDDPSILNSRPAGQPAQNLFGAFGASVAALAFQLTGIVSLLIPLFLLVAGVRWFRPNGGRVRFIRMLGVVLLLLFLPAIMHLAFGEILFRANMIRAGGWLGETIGEFSVSTVNLTGSAIILSFLVLVGFFLFTSLGPTDYARRIANFLGLVGRAIRGKLKDRRRRSREAKVIEQHYEKLEERGILISRKEGSAALKVTPHPMDEEPPPEEPKKRRSRRRKRQTAAGPKPQQLTLSPPSSHEYVLPPTALLDPVEPMRGEDAKQLVQLGKAIESKLSEFQVNGVIAGIHPGPVVTVFEFKPAPGIKISRILGYQDDLALALKAPSIRIDRIPNKSTVGIEVPNRHRKIIRLREILEDDKFTGATSLLTMAMGVNIQGDPVVFNLADMPHLLIGGTTGSGKSVGLNTLIMSILFRARPEDVKFILVDPKRVEMKTYEHIPHLLAPIINSPKKASQALAWAVSEMENRYKILADANARNIQSYRKTASKKTHPPMPYIVIVIDELADMLMIATKEVEDLIIRLAQMARAVGIHLILATQRPDKNVVTGLIKANIPARIAFTVSSGANSRVILDSVGAEKLLLKGDMLFIPPTSSRKIRLHGPFVSEVEVARVCKYIKAQKKPDYQDEVTRHPVPDNRKRRVEQMEGGEDEMLFEAIREVIQSGQASASHLQRRLRVGYTRAARLIDLMEARGIVGPGAGAKPREILVTEEYLHHHGPGNEDNP